MRPSRSREILCFAGYRMNLQRASVGLNSQGPDLGSAALLRKDNTRGENMKRMLAIVSLGVLAGFAATAVADDDHDNGKGKGQRVFRAQLVGFNEVPSVSTAAHGTFYAELNKE